MLSLAGCKDAEFSGYGERKPAKSTDTGNGTPSDGNRIPSSDDPGNNYSNNGDGKGGLNIRDWFGWGKSGLDIEFSKPLTAWHLGDNAYDNTSCKIRVSFNAIDGREFNFNFYVERSNTQLGIAIYHCGINPGFSNTATLIGPSGSLGILPLTDSKNLFFLKRQDWYQPVTLSQGWHKLKVVTSVNQVNGDYDDFIVGKIKLIAPTGPIRLGEVTKY